MQTLPVAGLDFDEIKQNFIEFVKSDQASTFTDFNFEGSGINALLNIFAYNTHYIGYYVKMLLNESFIDSALKRESLISRGKLHSYIPAGIKTAKATIKMDINLDPEQLPDTGVLVFPYGYNFNGNNYSEDYRKFNILDTVSTESYVANYDNTNQIVSYTFSTPAFTVYEGEFREWKFEVDANDLSQQFIISDKNIDLDTLKVFIHPNIQSDDRVEFVKADENLLFLSQNNRVYFITTTGDGFYEIFFGNNVFGQKLEHGNMIKISYLISSGETGNGCFNFSSPSRLTYGDTYLIFNENDYTITTIESSNGGLNEESIEDLRFNIPNHVKRQNRMVTELDYKTLLLEKYRNIDSINVWGGEKHFFKDYGSIYICLKPKTGLLLTQTAQTEIESYLKNYSVVGMKIKIIQPEYVYINLNIYIKYDSSITSLSKNQIKSLVISDIETFNSTKLDKFDLGLSDLEMLNHITNNKAYIKRVYDSKLIFKRITFIPNSLTEHLIFFGNEILPNSLRSNQLSYADIPCFIADDGKQKLYLMNTNENKVFNKSIGTIDYVSGTIKIIFDFDLDLTGDVEEIIELMATPKFSDINSYLNSILRINQITVSIE